MADMVNELYRAFFVLPHSSGEVVVDVANNPTEQRL